MGDSDWLGRINSAKEKYAKESGKKVRKDAVVLCSAITTVPGEWDKKLAQKYFEDYSKWYENFLQKNHYDSDCQLSCVIHYDETNPHMTQTYMPLSNGSFVCKKIMTKVFLQKMQREGWQFTKEWMNENGIPDNLRFEEPTFDGEREHLSEAEYKLKETQKKLAVAEAKLAVYESFAPEQKKIFQKRESVTVNREEYEQLIEVRNNFTEAVHQLAEEKSSYESRNTELNEKEASLKKRAEKMEARESAIDQREEKLNRAIEHEKEIIHTTAEKMISSEREQLNQEWIQLEEDKKQFREIVRREVNKAITSLQNKFASIQETFGRFLDWADTRWLNDNTTVRDLYEYEERASLQDLYEREL